MRRLFIKKRIREPVVTRDTHTTGSARQAGRRHLRPDPGRPSLFADFDQESVEDVDPQRIRLLSTLESQRGSRRRPHARRLPTGRTHPWLTRALMVAMGLGMLVMLLSFIQLLRRPPPAAPTQPSVALGAAPSRSGEASVDHLAQLAVKSASEAAEIIDLSPPAVGVTQTVVPTQGPATSAIGAQALAQPGSSSGQVAATPASERAAAALANEPDRTAKTAKPGVQRANTSANTITSAKRDAVSSPDDVALVEAMLAHAGPRKAPPSPTVALQQCGTGTSPQTSVCRAKVCVQHPSLPACHAP